MTEREYYTPAGFDAMKKRLSKAAIEKWITRRAFDAVGATAYLARTAEGGYEFALDHGTGLEVELMPPQERAKYVVHVWPPIGPEHAGPRQTMRDLNGEWLPEQTDVWATYYQPWFERVDTAFEGWDQLPDERDFHDAARNLEGAANFIKLDVKKLPELSGNDDVVSLVWAIDSIFGGRFDDPMAGKTISAFRLNYQRKLGALVSQQYWLAQALTVKLQATGDMWREARRNVMDIGHVATEALGDSFGRYDPAADPRQVRMVITAVGNFAELVANIKFVPDQVAAGAEVVAVGVEIYDRLDPPPVFSKVEEIFNGSTPENIMDNVHHALSTLNRQIVDEENAVGTWARGIADETYTPSTPRRVYFNLGPPQLITDSSAEHIEDELRINGTSMRYGAGLLSGGVAGTEAPGLDDGYAGPPVSAGLGLADHLDLASVNLPISAPSATAWQRPAHIGVNGTGAREPWTALLDRLVDLLKDTSGELTAAGEHLVLAADAIEGVDKNSQDALEKHVADVADVAAPEPGRPPRQETPVGGAQP